MKKNIIIYGLAAMTLTSLVGCEKSLSINPINEVEESLAVRTSEDVEAVLTGSYSDMGSANVYGGSIFVVSELLASGPDIRWSGTFETYTDIYRKQIKAVNNQVALTWTNSYKVINNTNIVLENLGLVDPLKKARVEGEAKFIRACMYFDLVRLFAKAWQDGNPAQNDGVPIVLKSFKLPIDDEDMPARAKVSAVYDQVINDLKDAENLLKVPARGYFWAHKIAAQAMLARVYLQKGDYPNAAAAADRAIKANEAISEKSRPFQLMGTYGEAFPINGDNATVILNTLEDVFAIQVSNTDGVNDFNTYFALNGRGDISFTTDFMDLFEADDQRADRYADDDDEIFYTDKFDNQFSSVHIIRYAELYLTRAEANFRLGLSPAGAVPVNDINNIRVRAGLEPLDAADLTLDAILHERRVELAAEGFNLHDIKRTMGNAGVYAWNANELVFPIPDRERKVNKNLSQNPGYGN